MQRERSTPLHIAGERDRVDLAQLALNHAQDLGFTINDENSNFHTALLHACYAGKPKFVNFVLELPKEANVDFGEEYAAAFDPLFVACNNGQTEVVKILLDYSLRDDAKVDFNWRLSSGYMAAYSEGHWSTAEFILKHSLEHSIDEISQEIEIASLEVAIEEDNLDFIQFFVVLYYLPKKKFLHTMKYEDGYTLLHLACETGQFQIVQYLVESVGFKVKQKDDKKRTPLDYAKKWDHQEIVDYLKQVSKSNVTRWFKRK